MLNKKYQNILDELKVINKKNREILDTGAIEDFEDEKAHSILEYLYKEIDEAAYELEHLKRDVKEGTLLLNSQGRYNLDTMPEFYFTCGNVLELLIDEEWHRGRVEHSNNDYYFCNYDGKNIQLSEGMKARIRVDRV